MSDGTKQTVTADPTEALLGREVKTSAPLARVSAADLAEVITTEVRTAGDLVDASQFTSDELASAKALAARVHFLDTNSILTYGEAPQRKMSQFLDQLLADITVGEAGVAGVITLELSEGYDLMAVEQFKKRFKNGDPGVLAKVFAGAKTMAALIKNLFDNRTKIVAKFDKIERLANERKAKLMAYNAKLDTLEEESAKYVRVLGLSIHAGEVALMRGVREYAERRAALLAGNGDDLEPGRLRDFARRVAAFEQRLLRMKIAYVQAIAVNGPRIQGIRQSGEIEIQNILEAVLFDVPNLKNLVLQIAAMANVQAAQREEAKRWEASKKIADAATEMFNETMLESVRSQGRGMEHVKLLAESADKLMATLATATTMEAENAKIRSAAAQELVNVKNKVQESLKAMDATATMTAG